MKEKYFTDDTINSEASHFMNTVTPLLTNRNSVFNPLSSALLVLDMQEYFLNEDSHAFIPSAKAIIPNILFLQNRFLSINRPIIQTSHINSHENAGQMNRWWKDIITENHPFSNLIPDIHIPGVTRITKTQYDAFFNTNLESFLRSNHIKQVVITGVMTHLCCESTARSAFIRGFDVFFGVDATATYNRNFHLASLLNLSHGFSTPFLSGRLFLSHDEAR
jgi:isochorismate hydrolase